MKSWKEYFERNLEEKRKFFLERSIPENNTELFIFKPLEKNNQTRVKIRILENGDLITLLIINPKTPGFTKQQEQEHFYRFQYDNTNSYGNAGLEFNKRNRDHFDQFLMEGLKGKEVQYYKNGELIKSEVFQYYAENRDKMIPSIITHKKRKFWNRLTKKIFDEIKTIELEKIF
ncbi:hypothetical protein [Christiangramia sabulilitoris]|uniref:Uncharacterized protein n=1 Tax=Christiangramia sabulilitoris TaxID=2583991 RepID=A0A550I7L7_9FLAO|nr:hypothetical protein [Christiangramia sabulilitoris]TRO66818.1 hypothetical protein FGM01_02690 [Christiangramia sabulilitoris]